MDRTDSLHECFLCPPAPPRPSLSLPPAGASAPRCLTSSASASRRWRRGGSTRWGSTASRGWPPTSRPSRLRSTPVRERAPPPEPHPPRHNTHAKPHMNYSSLCELASISILCVCGVGWGAQCVGKGSAGWLWSCSCQLAALGVSSHSHPPPHPPPQPRPARPNSLRSPCIHVSLRSLAVLWVQQHCSVISAARRLRECCGCRFYVLDVL